jgi:uncharacterized membrane protein YdfJ with MMPL/SSD domain
MKSFLALSLLGAGAAIGAQWLVPTGWWLNTGQGVAVASLVLALLAAAIAVQPARPLSSASLRRPVALWAGANIGLALVLFRVGPGNIFPIVLAFGAGISALAVGAGSLIGVLSRLALRRERN